MVLDNQLIANRLGNSKGEKMKNLHPSFNVRLIKVDGRFVFETKAFFMDRLAKKSKNNFEWVSASQTDKKLLAAQLDSTNMHRIKSILSIRRSK